MLEKFSQKTNSEDERMAALESRIAVLERKIRQLLNQEKAVVEPEAVENKVVNKAEEEKRATAKKSSETTAKKSSAKKTKAEKAAEERAAKLARKEELFQKKVEKCLDIVVAKTGWDREYAREKFYEARQRTNCTPTEYFLYRFYELEPEQQATFYLATYQNVLQAKYGTDKDFVALLYDKERTNNYFSEYVRRPWCVNTKVSCEQFADIFKNSKRIMYKPIAGHRGYGVEAFYLNPENIKEVYEKIAAYPAGVVEEFITQHHDMSSLAPASVNSLRFVTISSFEKPVGEDGNNMDIVYSIVRIGQGNSIVDNLHSGGMVANVDLETGTLATDGADRNGDLFKKHPVTGTVIKGFKIPYFEEARQMVIEAITKNKVEGYLGWDIAISENGPMLIEVNDRPGSDGLQTAYAQEHKGMKHVMAKYL